MLMAPEDEEKTEEEKDEAEPPEKKGGKKLLIIIILVVVLLGGGAAGYFFFFRGGAEKEVTETTAGEGEEGGETDTGKEAAKGEEGEETAAPVIKEGIIFPLDHFIVNVNDIGGEIRYLKIEIKLELENDTMQAEVENRVPKIRDSIVTILTNKSVEDVSDTNGKLRLKEEIKARINSYLTLGKIQEIYFTDFIIQ